MLRIARATFTVALLGQLLVAGPAAGGPQSAATTTNASASDLAQAAELRHDLGFDSSTATVMRASIDREAYPDTTFGIPLSASEAEEVLQRNQLALDAGVAVEVASRDPEWAGAWIDHQTGGTPVFQFAGDTEAKRGAIGALLPSGTEFRIESVARSLAALDAERKEIWGAADELREQGIRITGIGVDTIDNRLRLSIETLTPEVRQTITAGFGSDIEIREAGPAVPDACPETGCMPLKPGIGTTDNNDQFPCTIGYLAKRYDGPAGQLVAVTAGHCVEFASKAAYWKHGSVDIGVPSTKDGKYVEAYFNNSNADVGVIKTTQLSDSNRSTRNLLLYHTNGTTADITGQMTWASQMVNTLVCRTGRTTDVKCGIIQDRDEDKVSAITINGNLIEKTIEGTVVYKADALGGDSGGPVYVTTLPYPYTRFKATMYGTHVHSDDGSSFDPDGSGWYSAVDRGIAQLEASFPGFDIAMCATAACGLPDPIGD